MKFVCFSVFRREGRGYTGEKMREKVINGLRKINFQKMTLCNLKTKKSRR